MVSSSGVRYNRSVLSDNAPKEFRILALDGGGIKGVFTAGVLAELENALQRRCVDHFDLIVGTSTGSIIAIGLGLGMPAKEILDLYRSHAGDIFPVRTGLKKHMGEARQLFGAKHSTEGLRKVLEAKFGEKRLGDSAVRLVIPTFDAVKGLACTFKTAHHDRTINEFGFPAVEVAMASAAAPVFFPAASITGRNGGRYWDGGVWANCPAMVGIVEAVSFLGAPLDRIRVLSVGTTQEAIAFTRQVDAGAAQWGKALIDIFMAGQVSSTLAQARLLLGDRLVRIDKDAPHGLYKMDDAAPDIVDALAELGASVARDHTVRDKVETLFLNGVAAQPFVPIRS